jgi:hypothetical protein
MREWMCYDPDEGDADDASPYSAHDPGDAAVMHAEESDAGAGRYSRERRVRVREVGRDGWLEFRVSGEMVVKYTSDGPFVVED